MVFRVEFRRNHMLANIVSRTKQSLCCVHLKKSIDLGYCLSRVIKITLTYLLTYCCTTIKTIIVRVCLGINSLSVAEERQLGILFGDIFISNVSKI